jgi:hypothetical protein
LDYIYSGQQHSFCVFLGHGHESVKSEKANNIICDALALAAAINIVDGSALSVDYLISYYLTIVLFYAESYNLVVKDGDKDTDPNYVHVPYYVLYPDFPLIFRNILFAVYTLFGTWFLLKGIKTTQHTQCEDIAAIVFLFDFRNPHWAAAATALSIIIGVLFVVILFIHLKNLKTRVHSGPELVFVASLRMASGSMPSAANLTKLIALPYLLRPKLHTREQLEESDCSLGSLIRIIL